MALPARVFLLVALFALAACASAPAPSPNSSSPVSSATGARAAAQALKLVGAPYRYGGASPRGFDCSGLVQYSYRHAGLSLPHNTERQRSLSRPIRRADLRRGDLIFFDEEGGKNSHVGIYVGGGQFVHAPSSGKRVRRDRLDAPYWRKHLSELRRVAS
ncbi:MAG TPA: C40 family peptidase [Burkholderiales bacterium]|nr:C40 family peptidase [Burkholderiales bacterium]